LRTKNSSTSGNVYSERNPNISVGNLQSNLDDSPNLASAALEQNSNSKVMSGSTSFNCSEDSFTKEVLDSDTRTREKRLHNIDTTRNFKPQSLVTPSLQSIPKLKSTSFKAPGIAHFGVTLPAMAEQTSQRWEGEKKNQSTSQSAFSRLLPTGRKNKSYKGNNYPKTLEVSWPRKTNSPLSTSTKVRELEFKAGVVPSISIGGKSVEGTKTGWLESESVSAKSLEVAGHSFDSLMTIVATAASLSASISTVDCNFVTMGSTGETRIMESIEPRQTGHTSRWVPRLCI
jgi:hypothetical protein